MKKLAVLAAVAALAGGLIESPGATSAQPEAPKNPPLAWPAGLPVYDHVVIVVEENQDYHDILVKDLAPYIKNTLKAEGANFTKMYGEEHYSQGNYFWLFSGSNHNIGFDDQVPANKIHASNLGQQLIANKRSFKGYSEGLPEIGSTVDYWPDPKKGPYARKHVPWVSFGNVPNGQTIADSSNLRFSDFPSGPDGFATLPTVAFVIPNLDNDMHNGKPVDSIPIGDRWLKEKLDPYYQWAKKNNSLLILTFDENNDIRQYQGLTNPFVMPKDEYRRDLQNRIVTIFAGAHIKPGDYAEGKGITHVNVLRTLEAMYGLPRSGAQQPNAAGFGIRDDYLITDIFVTAKQ
jgi:acid phosphatase